MLHQTTNHLDILDHLDNYSDGYVHSSHFFKKSNISSTSSPEPQHHVIQPIQHFKEARHYEDGYRVSSTEHGERMGPPPTPSKCLKVVSSEEPTSSIPDLGEWMCESRKKGNPDKINKSFLPDPTTAPFRSEARNFCFEIHSFPLRFPLAHTLALVGSTQHCSERD